MLTKSKIIPVPVFTGYKVQESERREGREEKIRYKILPLANK
jgi:hypothetical protein